MENGETAEGIVFKNNRNGSGSSRMYFPVVRFRTKEDLWVTQELDIGYFPKLSEGKKIKVLYDPDEPTNVVMHSFFTLVILPRLLVALGITGIVIGLLAYIDIINF